MKTLTCFITAGFILFILSASLAQSQTQELEGYTFVRGSSGTLVCLGRWVQPRDVALPGVCEGQLVDVNYLTAVSARLTADRLDQMLLALASIDQKLATNNDQVKQLIESTVKTQTSIDQQVSQVSDLLSEAITERFDALSEEILANDSFKKELEKLKEDILKEVEKHYTKRPVPETK